MKRAGLVAGIAASFVVGSVAADGLPVGGGAAAAIAALGLPSELTDFGSDFAGAALATLIWEGAAEAERAGLSRMPPQMHAQMSARFPDAMLRGVRWGIAAPGSSLRRIVFEQGDAAAVTLGHVILFDDAGAAGDPRLWAHELTHVLQYERWGVDGFAQRYVRDVRGVEAEAEQVARDWTPGPPRERRPAQRPFRPGQE